MAEYHDKSSSEFDEADIDLLVRTLSLVPELLAAAIAAKRVQAAGVRFPVAARDELTRFLGSRNRLTVGDHVVDTDAIHHYLPAEFFPIGNEDELLGRFYLAFSACRDETRPGIRVGGDRPPALAFLDSTPDDAEVAGRVGKP